MGIAAPHHARPHELVTDISSSGSSGSPARIQGAGASAAPATGRCRMLKSKLAVAMPFRHANRHRGSAKSQGEGNVACDSPAGAMDGFQSG